MHYKIFRIKYFFAQVINRKIKNKIDMCAFNDPFGQTDPHSCLLSIFSLENGFVWRDFGEWGWTDMCDKSDHYCQTGGPASWINY